ncbi:MAG TPA: phosphoserine phosphatase SerB [Casimicrobiaceae bacterium]|nr:phosphoserine phosphatase SerB [Casimicrobiaceae bacterium]
MTQPATDADLVVQSLNATAADARAIAEAAGAEAVEPLVSAPTNAFRLLGASIDERVAEIAASRRLDIATVPRGRRLADVRVVAMDMDSTLITIECIDEIADMLGIKPQVALITESAMRGKIDFRASLVKRVALLDGLPVESLQRVYDERLQLTPGAQAMLRRFKAAGAQSLLVSGGFTFFTDRLKERVCLDHTLSNVLDIRDGTLTGRITGMIVDAQRKAQALHSLRASLPSGLAVAIGDGANDLPLFEAADVSVAFRAKPVVRAEATHALDYSGLDAVVNLFNN